MGKEKYQKAVLGFNHLVLETFEILRDKNSEIVSDMKKTNGGNAVLMFLDRVERTAGTNNSSYLNNIYSAYITELLNDLERSRIKLDAKKNY